MDPAAFLDQITILQDNILIKRIVIILAWGLLAKLTDLLIDRILLRLTRKTEITLDDQIVAFVHAPICWTLFGMGLLHVAALQPPLPPPWQTVVPAAAKTVIILLWCIAVFKAINLVANRIMPTIVSRGNIGRDLFNLLQNVARVVLIGIAVFWILSVWRVDLTPLFASAGIVGIAVALAAKDTLANFFGGLSIFADRTFKVGDYIIIDNTDRGEVVDIGIRSTRIKTRDDVLITIPNSLLANAKIINESAPEPRFRIRLPVGVAYGSDLDHAEKLLLRVAHANPAVVRNPEPRVRLRAFGTSSVDFELLCWIEAPAFKGLETHNLLKAIYKTFAEEGITIPFPQRDIHIVSQPESS